jgi:hypothetical protein
MVVMTAQRSGKMNKHSFLFRNLGDKHMVLDLSGQSPEHVLMIHLYAYHNTSFGTIILSRSRVKRMCKRFGVSQRSLIGFLRHSGFIEHGSQYPHNLTMPIISFRDYMSWKAIRKTPISSSYAKDADGVPLFASYQVISQCYSQNT